MNQLFKISSLIGFIIVSFGSAFISALSFAKTNPYTDTGIVKVESYYEFVTSNTDQARASKEIVDQLRFRHYNKLNLDNEFSKQVFDRYIEVLDGERSFFLDKDIKEFSIHRDKFDDYIKNGDLRVGFEIFNRFQRRMLERRTFLVNRLTQGIDDIKFDIDESIDLDRADAKWAKTEAELDELWFKRLKNDILNMRLNDQKNADIVKRLNRRYRSQLTRASQIQSEDAFQIYINAFAYVFDPHTQYFSPRSAENFNINMSLSLEGIGAILQQDDEYTKVVSLVPAGPADKDNELKPADKIVAVAQGVEEFVDVIGWRLDEVVELIRGPKESVVRLMVIPAEAQDESRTKVIDITRNKVKLEDQSAQKKIVKVMRNGKEKKLGVITIPNFYLDFEAYQADDPNYKSTSKDVRKLLEELKAENVEGVIVDLRNNGGGALQEANELTGLFIKSGPTVQIKSTLNRVSRQGDPFPDIAYDGPLAVLVDRLSASASEIFAGAIQDYGRGIVIGGRTFGKGTVQSLIPLSRGQLKLTLAKFYRVSGASTQNKGVLPDIIFPSLYDEEQIGESSLDNALPWDTINATSFDQFDEPGPYISKLKSVHDKRVEGNVEFSYQRQWLDYSKRRRNEKTLSLNEEMRRQEREADEAWRLSLENKRRVAQGKPELKSFKELEKEQEAAQANTDKEDEEADAFVEESGEILLDYIAFSKLSVVKK